MVSSRNQSLSLLISCLMADARIYLLLREHIARDKACKKVVGADETTSSHNKELVPSVSEHAKNLNPFQMKSRSSQQAQ